MSIKKESGKAKKLKLRDERGLKKKAFLGKKIGSKELRWAESVGDQR